jgi:transcriptional regulator of acetoin/glycerol metabolism
MPDEFGLGSAARFAVLPTASAVRGQASTSDEQLTEIVATFQGTRRELAAQLGISERTLYRRLKALGLA